MSSTGIKGIMGPPGIGGATGASGPDCRTCASSSLYLSRCDIGISCEYRQDLMFAQKIKDCWHPVPILLIWSEIEL